ncbi:MAG: YggU family protein [Nanoarchaeota archaeon]|nr:YggU family protein [Nanoarchaeota archaeon]
MKQITDHINNGFLDVVVKPNAPKTEVIGWDADRQRLRIAVAAVPDKDKANKELLKFLSKQLGKRVELVSGARSREKRVRIVIVTTS